jgi:hypothetical protein
MAYPPIADHGLIGDLQTAALVATDGTVDFYCYPVSIHRPCSLRCSTTNAGAASPWRRVALT